MMPSVGRETVTAHHVLAGRTALAIQQCTNRTLEFLGTVHIIVQMAFIYLALLIDHLM